MSRVLAKRAARLKEPDVNEPDVNELWKVEGEFPPVPSCFSLLVPVLLSCMYMFEALDYHAERDREKLTYNSPS